MITITIDPGQNGGIAWHGIGTIGAIGAFPMPMTPRGIFETLEDISCGYGVRVVIEKVGGYVPGNAGPAAVKFARHVGNIEGILLAGGYPFEWVTPTKWMAALGSLPVGTEAKRERKHAIKRIVEARFPGVRWTLKTSDAGGMLIWALAHS